MTQGGVGCKKYCLDHKSHKVFLNFMAFLLIKAIKLT